MEFIFWKYISFHSLREWFFNQGQTHELFDRIVYYAFPISSSAPLTTFCASFYTYLYQAYQIDAFTNADQLSQTGHQNGLALYSDMNQGSATGRVPQANVRLFSLL